MWALASFDDELAGIGRKQKVTPHQELVARLFEELREDVYRYLLSLGLHPPPAQEVTQEVFLRLYSTLKKGDDIQSHKAWIFRVAHNLGLKTRARQEHETPYEPDFEVLIASAEPSPETELLDRERTVKFHRAVGELSEQQRRVLFLRMEGLRYPEIGSAMGISASAVGEFLRRAMVRLRKVQHE
jgi:RNA polymerase sigma-70 factor, ECF subfamily